MSQQINLFDPQFRRQKTRFSLEQLGLAMGVVLALFIAYYGYVHYQLGQVKARVDDISKRNTAEQAKLARAVAETPVLQSPQQLEAERAALQTQVDAQQSILDSLQGGEMGNTSGYSEYMRAFARQSVSGLWLTGFEIVGDGVQMTLVGGTLKPESVPGYIRRLSQEKIMQGKTFAALQMDQGKGGDPKNPPRYVEFTLQSVLGGGGQ